MIRTRFSPSPTGLLHLGNVRAALFSALLAAKEKGAFLLRIEDTDMARSEIKFVEMLEDDLKWLGLNWQEGPGIEGPHQPYFQSERHAIYDNYYQQLEKEGLAYPCFCTEQELALNRKLQLSRGMAPRYPGTCKKLSQDEIAKKIESGLKPALRFRVPEKKVIEFVDLVKGLQKFNSEDIGDFIIRRAEGTSSFMFCNAIDDSLMEVSHVLRGEDHLANTPRQLMILQALKMRAAEYGHLSLIVGDDGAPLSKRHGSSSLKDLRDKGFLPLAVINYLSRLSHTYDDNKLLSFDELASHFQLERISRAPARFDLNQLLHWQKEAVKSLDFESTAQWMNDDLAVPVASRPLFIEVMRQNILFPEEAHKWARIFFGNQLEFAPEKLQILREAGAEFFNIAKEERDIKNILNELKTKLSLNGKRLFLPVRVALTGEEHGPELIQIADLLGPEKLHQRFSDALRIVNIG